MAKFQERFNAKMKEWYDSDKSTTEYERILAYLWSFNKPRKSEENIAEIEEFGRANIKALGDSNSYGMGIPDRPNVPHKEALIL
ncbi:MAG: hypothetical protein AAFQ91_29385 [Cyanobacteria bacterium J06621_15]